MKRVVLAFSGGSDSFSLLIFLKYFYSGNIVLYAAIVDHCTENSYRRSIDAYLQALRHNAIPYILRAEENTDSFSQDKGRRIRYSLIARFSHSVDVKYVYFAHTFDDYVEYMAMRIHHSFISSWSIFSPYPLWPQGINLVVVRPFLYLTKIFLQYQLLTRGIFWITDVSNFSSIYRRNSIRLTLRYDHKAYRAISSSLYRIQQENTLRNRMFFDHLSIINDARYGFYSIQLSFIYDLLSSHGYRYVSCFLSLVIFSLTSLRPSMKSLIYYLKEKIAHSIHAFFLCGAILKTCGKFLIIGRDYRLVLNRKNILDFCTYKYHYCIIDDFFLLQESGYVFYMNVIRNPSKSLYCQLLPLVYHKGYDIFLKSLPVVLSHSESRLYVPKCLLLTRLKRLIYL